ncbi:RNA polymerase II-associated protein 3 [Thoreauomyces humboldtii]|nr:RNA polymerase II-associated protein 3 [Thoreauomyces humboldtii]
MNVRQNAEELKDYLRDLQSWESEIKAKDKAAKVQKQPAKTAPPVRGAGTVVSPPRKQPAATVRPKAASNTKAADPSASVASAKGGKLSGYDYRAWDKFDVNEALADVDAPSTGKSKSSETIAEASDRNIEESLIEKEKGNAWFKKGDYKRAITCYTKSMAFDTSNAILPVNRAMAYLKLDKFQEAEKDCSTGLALDAKSLKALWRRGIARRELGKFKESQKDFEQALVLDPSNKAVKEDLAKLVAKMKPLQKEVTAKRPTTEPAPTRPVRRRLEIEEVGDATVQPMLISPNPSSSNKMTPASMTPVATKRTSPSAATPGSGISELSQPAVVKSNSAKIALVESAAKAPVKLSIEEVPAASSSEKPQPKSQNTPAPSPPRRTIVSSPPKPTSANALTVPKTMYEFERDWKSIKNDGSALYSYIKAINPADFLKIFKSSLESDYLARITSVLLEKGKELKDVTVAYEILKALSRLPRFDMTLMFLSKKEQQVVRDIFTWLRSEETGTMTYTVEDVTSLAKTYGIK